MRECLAVGTALRTRPFYSQASDSSDELPVLMRWMVVLAIVSGFCDESVRKAIPSHPVLVTAAKDVVFFLVGARLLIGTRWGWNLAALWMPWTSYVLASAYFVWETEHSIGHFLGVIRTYIGPICLMSVGAFIGKTPALLSLTKKIFLFGTLAAVVVAGLQEIARDKLPAFLSTQILEIDGHSFAGGRYNESLFGAPQTLSICCMVAAVAAFAIALYAERSCYYGSALLVLVSAGIYLSRIRTVYLLMPVAFFLVWLIMRRWHTQRVQFIRRIILLAAIPTIAAGLFIGLGGFALWARESGVDLDREARYLEYLTESEEHRWRLIYFMTEFEMAEIPATRLPFGFGAGTCGSLRSLLRDNNPYVPEAHDTGVFLLTSELGIFGLLAFLLPVVVIYVRLWNGLMSRPPSLDTVSFFASSQILFIWFLLKSYTIMNNGFTQMLWFASLGMAWGTVCVLPQIAKHNRSDLEPYARSAIYPSRARRNRI